MVIFLFLLFFSWNKAIKLDPESTELWDDKGTFLKELGRFEEALVWLFQNFINYYNSVIIKRWS